jgi:Tfp pilus assembly protein PilP
MRSTMILVTCGALALAACGDDEGAKRGEEKPAPEKAQAVRPGQPSTEVAEQQAQGAGGLKSSGKGAPLVTYPKVDDALYRVQFTADMFAPDPTGDKNRDPFRSYLVDDVNAAATAGKPSLAVDECDKRMVADQYGLRDLNLVGIVKKGTTAYALFIDSQGLGHIGRRGDCISKDKARLKEIGQSSIVVEVRGDAPPGQPAPEPREEEWKLHPEQLELGQHREGSGEGL